VSVNPLRLIKVRLVLLGIGKILSSHFRGISTLPAHPPPASSSSLLPFSGRYFSPGDAFPREEKGTFAPRRAARSQAEKLLSSRFYFNRRGIGLSISRLGENEMANDVAFARLPVSWRLKYPKCIKAG